MSIVLFIVIIAFGLIVSWQSSRIWRLEEEVEFLDQQNSELRADNEYYSFQIKRWLRS